MVECLISYILKYINNNDKEKNRVHRFLERSWYNIGNDESYDKLRECKLNCVNLQ